jgi:hypothetical protein
MSMSILGRREESAPAGVTLIEVLVFVAWIVVSVWAGRWLAAALNISAWITVPVALIVVLSLPLVGFIRAMREPLDADTPADDAGRGERR